MPSATLPTAHSEGVDSGRSKNGDLEHVWKLVLNNRCFYACACMSNRRGVEGFLGVPLAAHVGIVGGLHVPCLVFLDVNAELSIIQDTRECSMVLQCLDSRDFPGFVHRLEAIAIS